jgi:hypothetical protein
MYWDDIASLGRKYDLVNSMGLRGVGIFALQYGGGAPELWQELQQKFVGCLSATLTGSPGSPEPPGAMIHFTATSTGCTKPAYEYWVQYPDGKWVMKRGFGSGTWYWNTSGLPLGTYKIHVWANQAGNPTKRGEAIAEAIYKVALMPKCSTAGLAPATATQDAGTSVAFTASSTGCATPAYEYWVQYPDGKWHMKRGFSLDPVWTWNTAGLAPGTYHVNVWANQYGHSTAHYEQVGSSTITLTGCTAATLAPETGSSAVGTPVLFTAGSTGCANPVYEFWLQDTVGKWHLMRGFGAETWTWNNAGWGKGVYHIHAWAMPQGAYAGTFEVIGASTYTLS